MATVNQVRHDHANIARLLHVLSLRHAALTEGERPDFHLIHDVVEYIRDYMDSFVKPLERLYSDHLVAREFRDDEVNRGLAKDYQALRERLNLLTKTIDMILMDAIVPMDKFADDLKAYVDAHRAYLRAEREQLFPFFQEQLSSEQQQQLLTMLPGNAQSNLALLKEGFPQLYEDFKNAPSPFSQ